MVFLHIVLRNLTRILPSRLRFIGFSLHDDSFYAIIKVSLRGSKICIELSSTRKEMGHPTYGIFSKSYVKRARQTKMRGFNMIRSSFKSISWHATERDCRARSQNIWKMIYGSFAPETTASFIFITQMVNMFCCTTFARKV